MSLFQQWFTELNRNQQLALLAVHGAGVYGAGPKQIAIARFVRNCIFTQVDGTMVNTPITKRVGGSFGSTLVLEDMLNEAYVMDYRSRMASGTMPIAQEEFNEKTLKDLETNWPNYMIGFEQDLIGELGTAAFSAFNALVQAAAILSFKHPNLIARKWWSVMYEQMVTNFGLAKIKTVEELDASFQM